MGVIERDTIQTLALVDVSDDYGVELRQRRKVVDYSPEEAVALGRELIRVAEEAAAAQRADEEAWGVSATEDVIPGAVRPAHGFDAAPVCRECSEGKCGACNGLALFERKSPLGGDEVGEERCGCEKAGHQVIGGAS